MTEQSKPYYMFKVCLLGMGAVGKTCIAKRLCFNTFDLSTKLTIGIDFYTYDIPLILEDCTEKYLRILLWDFGGQEQFKQLFPYYINGANGIFMTFSLINLQSLINLNWWYEELSKIVMDNIPRILVGTKNDLALKVNDKSIVEDSMIKKFMNDNEEDTFIKTSAKDDYNIRGIFIELSKKLLEFHKFPYKKIG